MYLKWLFQQGKKTRCSRSHMPVILNAAVRGRCGFTAGRDDPLHNSQRIHHFITLPFLSILPSLLTPAFLQPPWFFFVLSLTSCFISAAGALASTFKHIRMFLLLSGWCHRIRRSERLGVLSDLLVCAAPDPLYCLQGSWEIHLCLLPVGFVFGICRFPQNCETHFFF